MSLIRAHLSSPESPEVPMNFDGNSYDINWPITDQPVIISRDDLPSLDYALYLINTVKFDVCQTYHLFDEERFMQQLQEFYNRPKPDLKRTDKLWCIQFLVVLAFGKAFLLQASTEGSVPGCDFFSRAVALLPSINVLFQQPLVSIEILCSISLYLQSVDHRNSAFTYVSI